jgi:hypothetical protein
MLCAFLRDALRPFFTRSLMQPRRSLAEAGRRLASATVETQRQSAVAAAQSTAKIGAVLHVLMRKEPPNSVDFK